MKDKDLKEIKKINGVLVDALNATIALSAKLDKVKEEAKSHINPVNMNLSPFIELQEQAIQKLGLQDSLDLQFYSWPSQDKGQIHAFFHKPSKVAAIYCEGEWKLESLNEGPIMNGI